MPARLALFFVLTLAGAACAAEAGMQAPDAAGRGRGIYENGTNAEGRPVTAWTGAGRTPLPAAFVACANCHATDGRGKSEGGVTAPDIRWEALDKPYGATRADGRRRPAYAEASFHAAITQGLDAGGQRLDPAMPRYALSEVQVTELVAYLKRIGRDAVPGVTDEVIRLGVIVPATEDEGKGRADLAMRVLRAWADELNRAGGVYRRRLEMVPLAEPAGAAEDAEVFAAISAADAGRAGAMAVAMARSGVPLLVAGRAIGVGEERRLFALYPGVIGEAQALVRHAVARREGKTARVAIVDARTAFETTVEKVGRVILNAPGDAESARQTLRAKDSPPYPGELRSPPRETEDLTAIAATVSSVPQVATVTIAPITDDGVEAAVAELIRDRPDVVLWLGDAAGMEKFATDAAAQGWRPALLLAGVQSPARPPAGSWIARATLPRDVLPAALAGYRDFGGRHELPAQQLAFQFALLASARLFAEALDNTGRELNREKFVRTLEALGDVKTGLTPPAGFSPRRHTAVAGMYVLPAEADEGADGGEWVGIGD